MVTAEKRGVCTNRSALHLWLAPPPFLATLLASRKSQGLYPHRGQKSPLLSPAGVLQTRTRGTSLLFIPQTDALSWVPFLPNYAGKLKLDHPCHRALPAFWKLRAAAPVREQRGGNTSSRETKKTVAVPHHKFNWDKVTPNEPWELRPGPALGSRAGAASRLGVLRHPPPVRKLTPP